MTKEELADYIQTIADDVRRGDSFEGSLEYTCINTFAGDGGFELRTAHRIGNLCGQGGMRLLDNRVFKEPEANRESEGGREP